MSFLTYSHALPDGRIVTRRTERSYSHVVVGQVIGFLPGPATGPDEVLAWAPSLEVAEQNAAWRTRYAGVRVESINGGARS